MSFSPTLDSTERPNTFTDDGVVANEGDVGDDGDAGEEVIATG